MTSSGCPPALLPKEACAFNLCTKAIWLVHNGKAFDELDRVPSASLSWLRNVAKVAEVVLAFKQGCSMPAHQATTVMCRRLHSDKQHAAALVYKQAVVLPSLTRLCKEAVWGPSLEARVRRQLDAGLHSGISPDTIEVKLSRTVQAVAVGKGVMHRRSADIVMVHLKQSNRQGRSGMGCEGCRI